MSERHKEIKMFKKKPKIAVIGSSPISGFHISALKSANFDICGVTASRESTTVTGFAKKYNIDHVWPSTDDLIADNKKWDGLLIASATNSVLPLLTKVIPLEKPILVEKPVALAAKNLKRFENNAPEHVIVGYNRRHYNTVIGVKQFVKENLNKVYAQMCLPEFVNKSTSDPLNNVRSNSVHGIDMLRFIFGDLTVVFNKSFSSEDKFLGRYVIFETIRGSLIHLNMAWNSPSNFSLSVNNGIERVVLEPFEMFSVFRGLEIIEPSKKYPLRKYLPNKIEEYSVFQDEKRDLKPGFYGQASEFMSLFTGKNDLKSADLHDAYRALALVEQII